MIYTVNAFMLLIGLWIISLIYYRFFERAKYYIVYQILFLFVSTAIITPFYFDVVQIRSYRWIVAWGVVFTLLWLVQKKSYNLTYTVSFFEAVWSVLSWQLVVELNLIIAGIRKISFSEIASKNNDLLAIILMNIVIIGSCGGAYRFVSRGVNNKLPQKLGPRQFILTVLVFTIFELISITYRWPFNIVMEDKWHQIFWAQVAGVIIFYLGCELFKSSAMKKELDMLQMLWGAHEEQYHLAKTNIDVINQKCHDLKHLVRALREASEEEREKYLSEIEDSIDIYEHIVLTGNDVLDTILSEKSLYCRKHNIKISVVADGTSLAFINTIDLYAIFGNALDNAIEAVKKIEDYDKRTIDVIVFVKNNFLIINIINPMENELIYSDGNTNGDELPKTTKGDENFHGYGLKSIQYIAGKYNGYASISTEDKCFSLKILIPIATTYDKK